MHNHAVKVLLVKGQCKLLSPALEIRRLEVLKKKKKLQYTYQSHAELVDVAE